MQNVLPNNLGLSVTGVVYSYTADKNQGDPFTVTIRNKNAIDSGYVFSKTDDWSSLPGNTIAKIIPVDNVSYKLWGDGEIKTTGIGSVKSPSVVYNYRIDTCYDATITPGCPGFIPKDDKINIYDALSDEAVQKQLKNKTELDNEEQAKVRNKSEQERDKKKVSPPGKNTIVTAENESLAKQLELMNVLPSNYSLGLPGGVYNDVLRYPDKKMLDSKFAKRLSLSQEQLHDRLIELQYNKKKGSTND